MISFKTIDDDYTEVKFPSNEEALKVVKSAPVHRWDPDRKVWTVETSWVELLCKRFTEKGFDCSINGKLWSPPDVKVLSSPIGALFQALPDHLRRPVYLALAKTLHPDAGGDKTLMQELNKAMGK